MIGFALGVLRLPPEAFWRMTPRELALAVAARVGTLGGRIARSDLVNLMEKFPDQR